ncbi:MAG: hypothetical protein A2V69_00300 [Candidatus Portnoybacteria bacterium RBG_13_40_8]|uniref:Uncharacterized protein n=1 Tax=Candidatus Portnoybacteria bacterium RBG_13_40_8 TaxID=1801990 RepID=A0A1G2F3U1_9BACT|nr:MAG: hypothetical protein A2V69_00300 [Candidatus Portnoybacteria bacterium RBG_13_40_8]HJX05681.1 flippase [Candidatus Nanoarchaeia archaeon]
MTNYFEKGFRGTVIVSLFTALAYLAGYFTRIFLARVITPEEYGLFYSVFTLFLFLCVFVDLGYGAALVKFVSEFLAKKNKYLVNKTISYFVAINIILGLFISGLLLALNGSLSQYYFKTSEVIPLIILFAFILILNSLYGIFQTVFQAFQDMFRYGLLYFLNKFLFLALCIILFYFGALRGVFLPGVAYLLTIFLLVLLFAASFHRKIKTFRLNQAKLKNRRFDKRLFLRMTHFALPNLLTVLSSTFIGYIGALILVSMVPMAMVGVYNAVLPTVLILSQLGGVIATVFFPMLSELWAKREYLRLKQGVSMIYRYCLLLLMPFSIVALFFANHILKIFFGDSFSNGATALQILVPGMIFLTLAQINFSVLNGIGKPKEITKIVVFAAAFNTVTNIILIPFMGINGAALTTTLSYLIMLVWSYILVQKNIRLRFEKSWSVIVISSFIFLGVLYLFMHIFSLGQPAMSLYVKVAISFIFSFIVYAVLAFLLKCITLDELKNIWKNITHLRRTFLPSVPPKD